MNPKRQGLLRKNYWKKDSGWTESQVFFGIGTACGKLRFYEGNRGYLCPVYSLNHKIKGFQIRVDHPVNKRKYIWFTSSGFDGGTSSGSPAGVSGYISPVQRSIHVTEGILKAELASLRSGYPYIGIPGLETIKVCCLCLQI